MVLLCPTSQHCSHLWECFPSALTQALYVVPAFCSVPCSLGPDTLWASPKDDKGVPQANLSPPFLQAKQSQLLSLEVSVSQGKQQ